MRNVVLLLIAVLGLYSFSGSKEERNAFIRKSIEERVQMAKMEIKDIEILKVKNISEREYEEHILRGGMDAISTRIPHTSGVAKKVDGLWEKKLEEKLAKLSKEKNYGYYVRVRCQLNGLVW